MTKQELLSWVDRDRDMLIGFLQDFIRCRTPNPPGDTIAAARHVRAVLDANGIDYRIISPHELMPNIVATFDGSSPGRHLALNGHMDVFPVAQEDRWIATEPPSSIGWCEIAMNREAVGRKTDSRLRR